jgi:FMN reductase
MAHVLTLSGSPSAVSRTGRLLRTVEDRIIAAGHTVERIAVRDLPATALLGADFGDPEIQAATAAVARADGLVVATPVYKASYTGLLKSLLDLLPQFALAGKTILPLATGGSTAHVLAIDYALRPVLTSMGAHHVVQGYFVLDKLVSAVGGDDPALDPAAWAALVPIVDAFATALAGSPPLLARAV